MGTKEGKSFTTKMRNQIKELCEELKTRFADVTVNGFEMLMPRTTDGLPPMRGRGFFPAADGLWKEDGDRGDPVLPFPAHLLPFVGQDFDKESKHGDYVKDIENGYQEEEVLRSLKQGTWYNLLGYLESAGIRPTDCFFTNLFPGVRIGPKNTGKSTALKDRPYVKRCVEFLDAQIRIMESRAAIIMGVWPMRAILREWLPERPDTYGWQVKDIDKNEYACFMIERETGPLKVGFICHPSMRNNKQRRYKTFTGLDAELEILRECAAYARTGTCDHF